MLFSKNMEYGTSEAYWGSPNRENLFNWYPFVANSTALEIDGNRGVITGLLCDRMDKVTTIEENVEAKNENLSRNKKYKNLEVLIRQEYSILDELKFDYIILGDARFETVSQAQSIFELVNRHRKETTVILVAVANPLGAKYLSGAVNPNTGCNCDVLSNKSGITKAQWIELIEGMGWRINRWYYPFPDHIFPTEIFSDESILNGGYGREYSNFSDERVELWEERAFYSRIDGKDVSYFVNSFLIEICNQPQQEVVYAKLNKDRKTRFQIGTLIRTVANEEQKVRTKEVLKFPLENEAKGHVNRMHESEEKFCLERISALSSEMRDDVAVYRFITNKNLDYMIKQWILEGKKDEVIQVIRDFFEEYFKDAQSCSFYGKKFCEIFGPVSEEIRCVTKCVCPANVDLICGNIYLDGDQYLIIDNEWIFDIPVPTSFILWRCINELYYIHAGLEKLLPRVQFLECFNISTNLDVEYQKWNYHFTMEYIGANKMEVYNNPLKRFQYLKKNEVSTKLYIDYGKGFSEENVIEKTMSITENSFEICYDVERGEDVKVIRWDPISEVACGISVRGYVNEQRVDFHPCPNSVDLDGQNWFFDGDPFYYSEVSEPVKQVRFVGTIRIPDIIALQEASAKGLEQEHCERDRLYAMINEKEAVLQSIYNSRSWKFMQSVKRVVSFFGGKTNGEQT